MYPLQIPTMSMKEKRHWYHRYVWSHFVQCAKATRQADVTLRMFYVWRHSRYVIASWRCGGTSDWFMLQLVNLTNSSLHKTRLQLSKRCHLVLQQTHVRLVAFHLPTQQTPIKASCSECNVNLKVWRITMWYTQFIGQHNTIQYYHLCSMSMSHQDCPKSCRWVTFVTFSDGHDVGQGTIRLGDSSRCRMCQMACAW